MQFYLRVTQVKQGVKQSMHTDTLAISVPLIILLVLLETWPAGQSVMHEPDTYSREPVRQVIQKVELIQVMQGLAHGEHDLDVSFI